MVIDLIPVKNPLGLKKHNNHHRHSRHPAPDPTTMGGSEITTPLAVETRIVSRPQSFENEVSSFILRCLAELRVGGKLETKCTASNRNQFPRAEDPTPPSAPWITA